MISVLHNIQIFAVMFFDFLKQAAQDQTWHTVFQVVIFLVLSFLGTSLIQQIKLWLKVQDRIAVLITVAISAIFAVAELLLTQVIGWSDFTIGAFPRTFFTIFALASMYYGWFKGSDSFLGKGGILKVQ